jgi:hypothetical protein
VNAQHLADCRFDRLALKWPVPNLTRKRVNNSPETWHIHYAGVSVGVIAERSGAPSSADQWEWHCSFYPGIRDEQPSLLSWPPSFLFLRERPPSTPS